MSKRIISAILSFCLVLTMLPGQALALTADEAAEKGAQTDTALSDEGAETVAVILEETYKDQAAVLPVEAAANDELFACYVDEMLYEDFGYDIQQYSEPDLAGSRLSGANKKLYDALKPKIDNLAANGGSAVFTVNIADILPEDTVTAWSNNLTSAMGMPNVWALDGDRVTIDSDFPMAVIRYYNDLFSIQQVMEALLLDCPYRLYWFDKTQGIASGVGGLSYETNGLAFNDYILNISELNFTFCVAGAYQDSTAGDNAAITVRNDVSAVGTAKTTAEEIVNETYDSDYARLKGYVAEICRLTDYDHSAADNASTPYGDPWQLIHVFDNDAATNVVCEGYSKAFKYLCDLTNEKELFNEPLECYIAGGYLVASGGSGVTGAGPHMWNIVTLAGNSYLVDVTNCDRAGSDPDYTLFLAGSAGPYRSDIVSGDADFPGAPAYSFPIGGATYANYWYESDLSAVWGDILQLSEESYVDTAPQPEFTVELSGTPRYNEKLSASLVNAPTGSVTYKWYCDGELITGATGDYYYPKQSDVHKNIQAEATIGDLSVKSNSLYIEKGLNKNPPGTPRVDHVNNDSILISSYSSGCEAAISKTNTEPAEGWVPVENYEAEFTGLERNTTYYIFLRYAENSYKEKSPAVSVEATTADVEPVHYLAWDEASKSLAPASTSEYTVYENETVSKAYGSLSGFCVIRGEVTIDTNGQKMSCYDGGIILTDGSKLTVNGRMYIRGDFGIYAQSEGEQAGSMQLNYKNTEYYSTDQAICCDSLDNCFSINGGKINVDGSISTPSNLSTGFVNFEMNGGDLTVTANGSNAAIGVGYQSFILNGNYGSKAVITINGGTVTTNKGVIGIGYNCNSYTSAEIHINGGVVNTQGLGTDRNCYNSKVDIYINGGKVNTTGSPAIGSEGNSSNTDLEEQLEDCAVNLTVNGGEVIASSASGNGIIASNVDINGGSVTSSGKRGCGIAARTININDAVVKADCENYGYRVSGGIYGTNNVKIENSTVTSNAVNEGNTGIYGANLTITDSTVIASGGNGSKTPGGLVCGSANKLLTITNSNITAAGGKGAQAIGSASNTGSSYYAPSIRITGGKIIANKGEGANMAIGPYSTSDNITIKISDSEVIADGSIGGNYANITVSGGCVRADGDIGGYSGSFQTLNDPVCVYAKGYIGNLDDSSAAKNGFIAYGGTADKQGRAQLYALKEFTLKHDVALNTDCATFNLDSDQIFTINEGVTLTNCGTSVIGSGAKIINNGTIKEGVDVEFTSTDVLKTGEPAEFSFTFRPKDTALGIVGEPEGEVNLLLYTEDKEHPFATIPVTYQDGVGTATYTMDEIPFGPGTIIRAMLDTEMRGFATTKVVEGSGDFLLIQGNEKTLMVEKLERTIDPPTAKSIGTDRIILNTVSGKNVEYAKEGGYWSSSPSFYSLKPGTAYKFFVRIGEDETHKVATSEAVTICTLPSEGFALDYVNETVSIADGYELNTAEDFSGTAIANGGSITDYIGQTLYLRAAGGTDITNVTIPIRPADPVSLNSVVVTDETFADKNDGKIKNNISGVLQYRKADSEGEWISISSYQTASNLAPGEYQVRMAAVSGTSPCFQSEIGVLTINSGEEPTYTLTVDAPAFDDVIFGYEQPAAKPLTITSSGNSKATISSVTVSNSDFVISGSGAAVAAGGKIESWKVQPVAGLAAGNHTATITVTYDNGAVAAAEVSFNVKRMPQEAPNAPTVVSKTSNSITLTELAPNENGSVAEYSIDGGQTWQASPVFTELVAGKTYEIVARYAEQGNFAASSPTNPVTVTTEKNSAGGSGGSANTKPVNDNPKPPVADDNQAADKFTDVQNHWAKDAVNYVVAKNLMNGTSELTFSPEENTTRGMIVTILYRLENEPAVIGSSGFNDVGNGQYYAEAVAWAAANDIVTGYTSTEFLPNGNITREQLAAILYRYADSPTPTDLLLNFADANTVSDYAEDACRWAVEQGILQGDNGLLKPQAYATRAEVAAMIMRYCDTLE